MQQLDGDELDTAIGRWVVGFGILLSGIPDEIASILFGLGWMFPILGVGAAAAAIVHAWRHRTS